MSTRGRIETGDWRPAPIDLAADAIEVAIGDVHGHADLLDALVGAFAQATAGQARLTFLGDLIDRGPDSLAALRIATSPAAALGVRERHLVLGNHEIMMLLAAMPGWRAPALQELWLVNGGRETLNSFGIAPDLLPARPLEARARLRDALGEAGWAVLEAAPLARQAGNLLFVHAGIDPDLPAWEFIDGATRLSADGEYHPAWIRDPFLDHDGPFEGGLIVAHGHTPELRTLARKGRGATPGVHLLDHARLGLDGGSYFTGIVAGAEFRRGRYRVLLAR